MKKKILFFAAVIFSVFFLPMGVKAAGDSGWHYDNNGWWYVDEYGEYPKDCIRYIHGEKYLFNERGYMLTGWRDHKGREYYFNPGGDMADSGWQKIDGYYYYFFDNGEHERSWGVDGYYIDEKGHWDNKQGWKYNTDYDAWHYVDSNGKLVSDCWKYIDGKYYYFYETAGVMAKGCTIDQYFINNSGVWDKSPGWKPVISGDATTWYYVKDNGFVVSEDWLEIDGEFYYFNYDGSMASYRVINGCYVNGSGVYDTDPGWKYNKYQDVWFYVNEDYKALCDEWAVIDGKEYHFDNWNGIMDRNKVVEGSYLGSSGAVDTDPGWKYDKKTSDWFYVRRNGTAAYDGWERIDGKHYYFYFNGAMVSDYAEDGYFIGRSGARDTMPGWKNVNTENENIWYYVKSNGKVATDVWRNIDGRKYHFYSNGIMASNGVYDGYFVSSSGARDTTKGWKSVVYREENNITYIDWFYVDESGKAVCSEWRKIGGYYYYFNEWGMMEKDSVIDGYYVDEKGIWRQ